MYNPELGHTWPVGAGGGVAGQSWLPSSPPDPTPGQTESHDLRRGHVRPCCVRAAWHTAGTCLHLVPPGADPETGVDSRGHPREHKLGSGKVRQRTGGSCAGKVVKEVRKSSIPWEQMGDRVGHLSPLLRLRELRDSYTSSTLSGGCPFCWHFRPAVHMAQAAGERPWEENGGCSSWEMVRLREQGLGPGDFSSNRGPCVWPCAQF